VKAKIGEAANGIGHAIEEEAALLPGRRPQLVCLITGIVTVCFLEARALI
jgi:hypothetical protein